MPAQRPGKGILIVGMHRSGTSVASRMANLAGAWLGADDELLPCGPDNPSGFWERLDVMKFNDRLLAALGRTWDTEIALSPGWENDATAAPFGDALGDMITKAFGGRPVWAVKDPRLCLLLPLWKKVLIKKGIAFSCLFVVRHPLEVALSLNRRNGFSLEKGLGCWLSHNQSAIAGLVGLQAGVLRFENLLLDWKAELGRAFAGAGLAWPDDARAFEEAVNAFLMPQNSQKFPDKGGRRDELPQEISLLYSRLMQEPFLQEKIYPKADGDI
ncbi:MAG: hypothetical protein QMD09_05340 [Desulfatibacillaceae bacterium]|nr:hypothetical protein [Desulfatibacillaceae bacterium]